MLSKKLKEDLEAIVDQMHKPGAPIENPMSPQANLIGAMKKQRQAQAGQRLNRAGAAIAMRRAPTKAFVGR